MKQEDSAILERLFRIIETREGASPEESYVAKSLGRSTEKLAQKLGEEAIETVIAAAKGDRKEAIYEAADLLFHLTLLCRKMDISPVDIAKELERRESQSGLTEKASRQKPA